MQITEIKYLIGYLICVLCRGTNNNKNIRQQKKKTVEDGWKIYNFLTIKKGSDRRVEGSKDSIVRCQSKEE